MRVAGSPRAAACLTYSLIKMAHEAQAARYLLTVEYVGTAYAGSQRQLGRLTVQEELEAALAKVSPRGPAPSAFFAGRTDSGVHATGMTVHTELTRRDKAGNEQEPFEEGVLLNALNAHLRERCGVVAALRVPRSLDARWSATMRTYVYLIKCPSCAGAHSAPGLGPLRADVCSSLARRGWISAHDAHRAYCVTERLDVDVMREVCAAGFELAIAGLRAFGCSHIRSPSWSGGGGAGRPARFHFFPRSQVRG